MTKQRLNNFFFMETEIAMNLGRGKLESRREFIDYFTCVNTAGRLPSLLLFPPPLLNQKPHHKLLGSFERNLFLVRLIPSFTLFYFIQAPFSIMSNFIIITTSSFIGKKISALHRKLLLKHQNYASLKEKK